jgi:hypothetical protein
MQLPTLDFTRIAALANAVLAQYGTEADFYEHNNATPRRITLVVQREAADVPLLQDMQSMPVKLTMRGDDFKAPNRLPKQFDAVEVTGPDSLKRIYTLEQVTPVYVGPLMPCILCLARGN